MKSVLFSKKWVSWKNCLNTRQCELLLHYFVIHARGVYEGTRTARVTDLPGIRQLIQPLEVSGTLVQRTDEEVYALHFFPWIHLYFHVLVFISSTCLLSIILFLLASITEHGYLHAFNILLWFQLLQTLDSFIVVERDGSIIACAALFPYIKEKCGEVAAIAVSPECRGNGQGDKLLGMLIKIW